jgi:hypothetical protein
VVTEQRESSDGEVYHFDVIADDRGGLRVVWRDGRRPEPGPPYEHDNID